MLLENNSEKTIKLIDEFDKLNDIDKLRLSINTLESKYTNYNFNNEIELLKNILSMLDNSKAIINFSKYQKLTYLKSKYIELDKDDKDRYIIEILFNIYDNDFDNQQINNLINENLDIYNLTYKLLNV